jgi:hypothetical protein
MRSELTELMKVVERMPPEMAREVLNFALFLQRKQEKAAIVDVVEEGDSHYGTSGDGFDLLDRWDAIESPASKRDLA